MPTESDATLVLCPVFLKHVDPLQTKNRKRQIGFLQERFFAESIAFMKYFIFF